MNEKSSDMSSLLLIYNSNHFQSPPSNQEEKLKVMHPSKIGNRDSDKSEDYARKEPAFNYKQLRDMIIQKEIDDYAKNVDS